MPIPGLDKATRNARGRVDYSARIVLIIPAEQGRGNGTLLVDVPNRGRAYAEALYNSPREEPYQSGTFEQGTGYLQDYGFSVAEVSWELGQGADLPTFVDAEGKKRYVEGVGFAIIPGTCDTAKHVAYSCLRRGGPRQSRSVGGNCSEKRRLWAPTGWVRTRASGDH